MELPEECQVNLTVKCAQDFLKEIQNSTAQNLSQEDVESYLNTIMNLSTRVINEAADRTNLTSYGRGLLDITEELVSKMVKNTDTYSNIGFSVQNLEVQVFMIGPYANLRKNVILTTSNASMDINLNEISQNYNGSAAVAFISYNNMEDIFNPNFTITQTESKKTLMSAMISPLLLWNKKFTIPANFTLKHIKELGPESIMSCMDWRNPTGSNCVITNSNKTHTVCSCGNITNFALISETDMCRASSEKPTCRITTGDVQTIMIGPKLTLDKTPRLNTSHASLDIDLIGISKTNNGSAAVMFMSYTTMAHQLKLFPETDHLNKIIMSTLVTVNLFKTSKPFSKPVNFTLKHINGTDKDHEGILSCVNTQLTWDLSFCNVTWTNSTHTVCSCKKQGDLILYMLTIPDRVVERYLNIVMKLIIRVKSKTTDQNDLRYCGKSAVNLYEKLLSQMVEKTESHNISITLQNLEVQVLMVTEPNDPFIFHLSTSGASLEIYLTRGPAAVAFMSYTNMADILEPRFFKKADKTMKIMMSTVVSATFLKRTNTHFSKPVKFIFKHISALDPEGDLFCVYWKDDEWAEDGCTVTETNSTHTVCSCNHLSVFALIMEIIPCKQACAVMSGIRSFFFISGFVWMLIETVLLFLLVKNLSKIRSNQREVISMEWLNMIGYLISLVVVTLCTQFIPQNNVEEQCWDNRDTEKNFDTPIICIVATNMILYIVIIVIIIFNLNQLKNENLQRNNTDDKDLIMRVMIKSLAQFVILGCYWIFLYIPDNTGVLYNTFLFLNSQQGTFIFLVHCLLNQEVRQQYRKFVYAFFCFGKLDTTTQIMETEQ
ncbi:hypothetical protein QTP86_011073 [Hemibagrus guttatus]|nr:hypothetical protein QTP86_011073 [Hemibagrus guttatus]